MPAFCVKNSITHPLAPAASMYLQCRVHSRGMQNTRCACRGRRCAVTQSQTAARWAKGQAALSGLSTSAKYITNIWLRKSCYRPPEKADDPLPELSSILCISAPPHHIFCDMRHTHRIAASCNKLGLRDGLLKIACKLDVMWQLQWSL